MGWIDESFSTIVHVTSFHLGPLMFIRDGTKTSHWMCWKLDSWGLSLDQLSIAITPVTCSDYVGRSGSLNFNSTFRITEGPAKNADPCRPSQWHTQLAIPKKAPPAFSTSRKGLVESSLDISLQDPKNSQVGCHPTVTLLSYMYISILAHIIP